MSLVLVNNTSKFGPELHLRDNFNLNPSMSASSLTTKINNAVQAAISAGRRLSIGFDQWAHDGPIVVNGPLMALRGEGVGYAFGAENYGGNMSTAPNPVAGAMFMPQTAGQDCIQVTGDGTSTDFKHFGCQHMASPFVSTGCMIKVLPPNAVGHTYPHHGIFFGLMEHLISWGGSQYAIDTTNCLGITYDRIFVTGAGGIAVRSNGNYLYGNSKIGQTSLSVVCAPSVGEGHGIFLYQNAATFPTMPLNLMCYQGNTSAFVGQGAGLSTLLTTQKTHSYSGLIQRLTLGGGQCDFESATAPTPDVPANSARFGNWANFPNPLETGVASGTVYENSTGSELLYYVTCAMNTSGSAVSSVIAEVANNSAFTSPVQIAAISSSAAASNDTKQLVFRVPTDFRWFRITATNATISGASPFAAVHAMAMSTPGVVTGGGS